MCFILRQTRPVYHVSYRSSGELQDGTVGVAAGTRWNCWSLSGRSKVVWTCLLRLTLDEEPPPNMEMFHKTIMTRFI